MLSTCKETSPASSFPQFKKLISSTFNSVHLLLTNKLDKYFHKLKYTLIDHHLSQ